MLLLLLLKHKMLTFQRKKELDIGYRMSEAAATAVKPFSSNWNPVFECMPVGQDQVSAIISSVSNTLDPQSFYDALETQTAVSKLKMSVGATSIIEPEEDDDLWTNEEPWSVTIDISSLEKMVDDLDKEVGATATRASGVTPERLSKIWSIDIETAKRTIDLTSQHVKHEGSSHLKRRYSTNDRMLRYKRIRTHFFMDTFQVTAKAISQQGNRYMQLFVSDTGYMFVYPMKAKTEIVNAVKAFAKQIGVPTALILDPEGTQTSKELAKVTKDMCCPLKFLERATQWGNLAELYIGLLKEAVRKDMKDSDSPLRFWDYCAERRVMINNLTSKNLFQLNGANANLKIIGDPCDISNLCSLGWFEWCYFRDGNPFPYQEEKLGRCLGPSANFSNEMAQWILKDTMKITASHSCRCLTEDEYRDLNLIKEREDFMEKCWSYHGNKMKL